MDGSRYEGTGPLGVRDPEVFFCGLRRSDEVCGWMCGWILPAISEKRPITSHSVLFELSSKITLSVPIRNDFDINQWLIVFAVLN